MAAKRKAPMEITEADFRSIGYNLIDRIAAFNSNVNSRPVTTGKSSREILSLIGQRLLPYEGTPADTLVKKVAELLLEHSLYNGHPKFFGYITSSPAPIGALADLLAASINPNVGAQILSPVATEIEKQTVKWLAEFIHLPGGYGGILVSGGNMANFTAFRTAITVKAPRNLKEDGMSAMNEKLVVYCSKSTHTWIEKAATLFGLGLKAIRWISTDSTNRMDNAVLENAILTDIQHGYQPIMVIGTAGDVSTGVVDDLRGIAQICTTYNLWFHVDGAYGVPAAIIDELQPLFDGLQNADSIALDPHKWLYAPLEAGCTLVREPKYLNETFSSHPDYYNFESHDEDPVLNYYEYGFQNSRGFRALKVWLALQQVGQKGYISMIREDIRLSKLFFNLAATHPELEAVSQNLSIATFRYVPTDIPISVEERYEYLNLLNKALLDELQRNGEVFLSNAVITNRYCLRACIVNFRTSEKDVHEAIAIITREGQRIHQRLLSNSTFAYNL